MCIKSNAHNNNDNNENVSNINNDNKSRYEQGGKNSKDIEWN